MSLRAQILAAFEDVVVGARLLWRLPSFLRQPVSVEDARAVLRGRLERREADFLALVKHAVFDDRGSPYRQLLSWAGCEYGDVKRLVEQRGVEGALDVLFRGGVYLTADELKGRRPTVRGNATLTVDPDRLRNRALTSHLLGQSTGSGGPRTPVRIDLASVWDQVVDLRCNRPDSHEGPLRVMLPALSPYVPIGASCRSARAPGGPAGSRGRARPRG